ncbi:hypothetical protein CRYUN_Cryun25bG0067100 [Craigia yunnanensis]
MTVIDILFRVDEIYKKYEKYDPDKQRELNAFGDDAFDRLYALLEADIDKAINKSEMVLMEKNRAAAVAMSAEIRRTKARLMDEVPKLQKLAKKKVKGISQEDQETRFDMVLVLPERIKAIPDGSTTAANQTGGWRISSSNKNIKFDSSEECFDSDFYQQTEESNQFRQEYEMRKMKQACKEMDRQVPLMDEIETKVDKATSDIRRTNVRLKKTVTQIRSS